MKIPCYSLEIAAKPKLQRSFKGLWSGRCEAGSLLELCSRPRGSQTLSKEQRHRVFADFVATELFEELDGYVLEVAGGKGQPTSKKPRRAAN